MTTRTTIKVALALVGLVCFGVGVRYQIPAYRWIGIALVAVAWFMRFWKAPEQRG